ncbi:hypothetical protein Tco_0699281 [Tanacetum coccineum]
MRMLASLYNLSDADFLDQFSISVARQACMGFELWLRYEHGIDKMEHLQKKLLQLEEVIHRKDKEIVDLKSCLEKLERDSTKDVGLRGRVL